MNRGTLEREVVSALDKASVAHMVWGVDDCALWVANIIHAALGYDPAASVRGRYKTRRGSLRVTGYKGLLGQLRPMAKRHGWKRISPVLAQAGDVGLVWTMAGKKAVLATVICRDRGWFVGRNERGFSAVAASKIAYCWSVLPDALPGGPGPRVHLPRAVHEPISAAIGLTDLLVSVLGVSAATAGAIGGAAISIGLSIGVSLVSALLQPHADAGVVSSDTTAAANQITERQAIPYKRVIVGSAYVGGALFFEQVKPPYLTQGILINYGQITSVDQIFIGTNQLAFTSIVPNTILTPVAIGGQPDYPNHLKVSLRYGSSTQPVDPLILNDFPNVGATFQQAGNATAVYRYHYGGTDTSAATQAAFTALWGQVSRPTAYVIARGAVVYDPRDPTQSLTDETTWKWSDNATLVQAWYLTRYFGGRIPKAKIRWDKIATSAAYDDTLMGCNDGTTIKKHTIDGVITLNQQPSQVMQDMLTANRAMVLESGGKIWIQSSAPRTPIATIHDRILTGGITYNGSRQKSDLVNKLQVRFVSPDQDYQVVDGPILNRTDLQAADQETLTATLALNYTQDQRRAQRLQKCFLESSRLGRTIQCTVALSFMATVAINTGEELIGSVVTVASGLFANVNGTYLIAAVGFADDMTTLSLALTEYDATIEADWNPEVDEQPFVLASINTN